jgi:hypothetical protein
MIFLLKYNDALAKTDHNIAFQQSRQFFAENWPPSPKMAVATLLFSKVANFFAENVPKSPKMMMIATLLFSKVAIFFAENRPQVAQNVGRNVEPSSLKIVFSSDSPRSVV